MNLPARLNDAVGQTEQVAHVELGGNALHYKVCQMHGLIFHLEKIGKVGDGWACHE